MDGAVYKLAKSANLAFNTMEKGHNLSLWVQTGYELFAEDGLEGLQVERLARMLNLNKSGFYYYFGDLDVYCEHILKLHESNADLFIEALLKAKNIEPDYLTLLITWKVPVMVQTRMTHTKNKPSFLEAAKVIDSRKDVIISKLWCDYLGIQVQSDAAIRYFGIVRDMFYARITFKDFNYPYLQNLLGEARVIINQLVEDKTVDTNDPLLNR